ncbi:MAG: bifunctional phosphoglucose/phosphomannose isomerase [Candidatus Saccharimonadales bacterium]
MLDDLKLIHNRDGQDALGVAEKQWQQYSQNYNFAWQPPREVKQVIVAGMGGSGLAAKVIQKCPGLTVSFEVVQDYVLPGYVDESTLVVCSSYSGNTEETRSVFDSIMGQPEEKRPMVVVVASGGILLSSAQENKVPFIELPGGYQPRMTLGYQMRALLEIFEQARLVNGAISELESAAQTLEQQIAMWVPTVATKDNPAKQLAQELMGKSPVIYAGPNMFPVAYKWKISFNENAKNVAWCNQLPEFNHNEFLGWTSHPTDKPYGVIDLRSSLDDPRVKKRFEVSEKLLSGLRPHTHVVEAHGDSLLQQILWTVALGDFVSLYLALLNGLNPTPVDLIEKFKVALTK